MFHGKQMESEEAPVYFVLDHFKEEHDKEMCELIDGLPNFVGDDNSSKIFRDRERPLERCVYLLNLYQEQPHLLDPKIPTFVDKLVNFVRSSFAESNYHLFFQSCHFLRQLIKVRGYKMFGRFLPHDHADLIPVLSMLEEQGRTDAKMATTEDICVAEYVLLIWMSMLCRIPFDFSRFDCSSGDSAISTSRRIYNAVTPRLLTRGSLREAAAYCLSIFVSRPDSIGQYLHALIFDDILPSLNEANRNESGVSLDLVVSARCLLLASLLKRVKREEIPYDWSKLILENIFRCSTTLAESKNILIRKLTTKMVVRSALTMLKPRIAPWRYQRGSRSLAANLTDGKMEKIDRDDEPMENDEEGSMEQFDMPDETESVINYLLVALKDKDTVCRWSAAKGFGRLCARLPRQLADQVVSALLSFFDDELADASRHGACLALAELGRRGLLLPSRLSEVVPLVVRALTYDEQRGTYSVGSNVRDAACYVCWSFARAYAPVELRQYNLQLAVGLLTTAIYDREVNCRRAASAAFQEHVGRQAGQFPHGIDLLTAVDYFAVRSRKHCYCELSRFVASFPEYRVPMIDHLVEQKIGHWDESIRQLASDALRELSSIHPDYVAVDVIPKLLVITKGYELLACQGAIFAVGRASAILHNRLSPQIISELLSLPPRLMISQLYKGIGGELVRKALNDFIENLCQLLDTTVSDSDQKREYCENYLVILDENVIHEKEEIRQGARRAMEILFDKAPLKFDIIMDRYWREIEKSIYERQRSGAAFALASFPRSVLTGGNGKSILAILMRFSVSGDQKGAPDSLWAIARRDCLQSLAWVVQKLGMADENGLDEKELELVMVCYTKALDDYSTDSRGDVGSVVREAGISGLKGLFSQILQIDSDRKIVVSEDLVKRALKKILQQCCEKIDRTRELACESMEKLIGEAGSINRIGEILHFPNPDILINVFSGNWIDWTKANEAYPKLVQLLNSGEFRYPVLLGFGVTVGGMTESSVKASLDAFLDYMGKIKDDQSELRSIVTTLVSIFNDHRKIDRVTVPLMKLLDHTISSNYLDDFLINDDDAIVLEKLVDLCIAETRLSKNSQKVLAGVAVCSGFLRFEGSEIARKALKYELGMLVHPYPRVRREAASQLYQSIMEYFTLDNHSEQVLTVLTETDWDEEPKKLEESKKELEFMLKVG